MRSNPHLTLAPRLARPQSSPVAASYAVALAESAQASNTLDQIHADVETFSAYSLSNAGIASVLSNPVLSDAKKKDLVAKIAKEGSFSPVFVNFLNLLISKRRINLINQILAEFEAIYCDLSDTQARTRVMRCCAGVKPATLLWAARRGWRSLHGIRVWRSRYLVRQRCGGAPPPRAFRAARRHGWLRAFCVRRCAREALRG